MSQDTVYATPLLNKITLQESVGQYEMQFYNCAHGHECCSSGCRCCPELSREQLYDTIYHPVHNGIQRITVIERFFYAESHDKYPVHFYFKIEKGEVSQKWYRADLNPYFGYDRVDGIMRYPGAAEENYLKTNSVLVADDEGDHFLLDLDGNILPMTFHSRRKVNDGVYISSIIVNNQLIYGFSDEQGNKIGSLNYRRISPFDENGVAIAQTYYAKFGLVNCNGEIVLPFIYDNMESLGEDRYLVYLEGKSILIAGGENILNYHTFLSVNEFSEGLAFARKDEKTFVYIDLQGKEVFKLNAEWGYEFHDGMAAVLKDKKWGYVDKTGKLVIDYQFDRAWHFENGAAPVAIGQNSNTDEWRLIDRSGKYISDKVYDDIERFKGGLARTFVNGQGYGMIDTKGKELFTPHYSFSGHGSTEDWYINGTLIRTTIGKENSLELIDRKGNQLLSLSAYVAANYLNNPKKPNTFLPFIQVYKKGESQNLLSMTGHEILKHDYQRLQIYSVSTAIGLHNEKWYILDLETGESIFELSSDRIVNFEDGIIQIENKDKPYTYDYFDIKGNPIRVFGNYE